MAPLELSKVLALVAQLAELSAGMWAFWWVEKLEDHKLEQVLVVRSLSWLGHLLAIWWAEKLAC